MATITMPPETWTIGSEMPKKCRITVPSSSMIDQEDDVVDRDLAGERAIGLGGRLADETEEDERGAERIDQRQQRAERDEE